MRHMVVIADWDRFGTVQTLFSGEVLEGPLPAVDDAGRSLWSVRSGDVIVNQLLAVHVEVCDCSRDANLLVHRLYEAGSVLSS